MKKHSINKYLVILVTVLLIGILIVYTSKMFISKEEATNDDQVVSSELIVEEPISESQEDSLMVGEAAEEEEQTVISSEHYLNRQSLFETLELNEDSVVFVGDSLVQRNEWSESFQNLNYINRGIDFDTISGVLNRIPSIVQDKPKQIFLLIGINDVYRAANTQEELIEQYQQIINQIKNTSKNTSISIISLLPVNNTSYNHPINNDSVVSFNQKLSKLSETNQLDYIDVHSQLVDGESNELKAEYTNDGIHLTGEAYTIMSELITPYIK